MSREPPAEAPLSDIAAIRQRLQQAAQATPLETPQEPLKAEIQSAIEQVDKAFKLNRDPNNPTGQLGIKDLLDPFLKQGFLSYANGRFEANDPAFATLAKVANKRLALLNLAIKIQKDPNGFWVKEERVPGEPARFAFRLLVRHTDLGEILIVSDLVTLSGDPSIKNGRYGSTFRIPPPFLVKAAQKRAEERNAPGKPLSSDLSKTARLAKPPEKTRDEKVQELLQAIDQDRQALDLIPQALFAFANGTPHLLKPGLSAEGLETLLRQALGIQDRPHLSTPKGLGQLAKLGFRPHYLKPLAERLRISIG